MTADTIGGVWTYAVELAHGLSKHNFSIALATMGAPLTAEQRRNAGNLELHESSFRLEWMENPWDDVARASEWLLDLEKRLRPDIVHLNGYAHGSLPWRAPVVVVGHSCVLSWWEAVRSEPIPALWDDYRTAVTRGLAAANLVVAPSSAMLESLKRHYGLTRRSTVVYNGRDPDLFRPGIKEPFVFSAGRLWDEAKNLRALDAIAGELPWPVLVAGEQRHPEGGAVEHASVRALGRLCVGRMADWLARASIYVLPACYEPFGYSVLEAGLAGCALVLGDIPSLRELWHDAALFVPPHDLDELRAAVQALISNDAYRTHYAELGRKRALEFTAERMAAGYVEAYRSVAGGTH